VSEAEFEEFHGGHFYGSWHGRAALAAGSTADLVKALEAKYPGSSWGDIEKLDPEVASTAAGEVDAVTWASTCTCGSARTGTPRCAN
jgi:hypothetical protein